jgi:GTPase SAR1 family protein
MQIVMLGHSNAGKTTYVSAMYEVMSAGVERFFVVAERREDHARLAAAARAIHAGRYPELSDHRQEYRLRLRHGDSQLIEFTWRDYRGGALLDRSSSRQAMEMQKDLEAADGIVIFIDAPELVSKTAARRKARSVVFNVMRALEHRSRTTPIVLAYTKWDLFTSEPQPELLIEPFESLIQAVSETTHLHLTVIDLACGRETYNVAVPVLWCLYFGIAAQAERIERKLTEHLDARDMAAARDTLGNRFSAWWSGGMPQWKLAVDHHSKAYAEWQRLEPLIAPAEHLRTGLEALPHY